MKQTQRGVRSKAQIKSAHVPEQYWGYSLQAVRFLQLLMESPAGSTVSLEVIDDVGVVGPDGVTTASQSKSALVKNPVSDRAPDLWKTFGNWVRDCESGALDVSRTVFEIYVGKRRTGSIVKSFHDAATPAQAIAALASARKVLWGEAPFYRRRSKLPALLRGLTDALLAPARIDTASQLVSRFRLASSRKDPIADVRSLVTTKWVRPESVDLVVPHAYGWVKERIDELLQERRPALLSVDAFNAEMGHFLPRVDFRTMLISVAPMPTAEEVAAQRTQTYVHQLEIIDLSDEDTIHAINSYLRAASARTEWSRVGIVHEDSFDEFEDSLMSFWRNKRRQNEITHSALPPAQQGQLLLSDCCLKAQTLQGLEVPSYFTPGSFHALADGALLGWHPKFLHLVSKRGA